MTQTKAVVRVAAVQAAPVHMNLSASIDKAIGLAEQAREKGCDLIAFGEAWLPDFGFFHSLGALERWTHSHPTHTAIMGSFMGMVQRFEGSPGLHLWHEVTVFPAHSLVGDYVNCSADGGLMG